MELLFRICIAVSVGVIFGFLAAPVKLGIRRLRGKKTPRDSVERQIGKYQKLWKAGSRLLTFCTFLLLILGLIWCAYFLILGALSPEQAEYANNMSELIVAILTIVSIMFAFYEFVRRK